MLSGGLRERAAAIVKAAVKSAAVKSEAVRSAAKAAALSGARARDEEETRITSQEQAALAVLQKATENLRTSPLITLEGADDLQRGDEFYKIVSKAKEAHMTSANIRTQFYNKPTTGPVIIKKLQGEFDQLWSELRDAQEVLETRQTEPNNMKRLF